MRWLPLALFLGLALALGGGWAFALHADAADARERDQILAEQTSLRVSDWVNSRLALLRALKSVALAGQLDDAWGERIRHSLQQIHGFQAINWIDARGVITHLAPTAGNEAALGRDLSSHPVVGPTLRASMADLQDRLSPPIDLYQGGRGFTAYIPVRRGSDGPLVGFVNGVFLADRLVSDCIENLAPSHSVVIADGSQILIATTNSGAPESSETRVAFQVLDRTWTLTLRSRHGGGALAAATLVFVVGLLLSAALAWLLRLALVRQAQITEAHAHRARIEARLRSAERLEAMGHLAGGVAHDFNNLLTVILGHADLLGATIDDDPGDTDGLRSSVAAIRDASVRAAAVTSQLLAFARREPVTHGIVDATAHIHALAPMLRKLATEAVSVTLELPDEPLWTACSAAVIDRILVNLVANARDACDGRGAVTIRAASDDDRVRIDVRDDGRGMPKEVQAHIFEPFFTTRAKGSGLGLATVYGLVTQRGGKIEAASEVGVGTTVTVRLLSGDPPDAAAAPPPNGAASNDASDVQRVRLVEDNSAVRATVRRALRNAGFRVADFEDGESALADDAPFDLLVTDLVLPGIDGVAVATELLDRHPQIRVIVVSGYADRPGAIDALLARGARFLAKPFEMRDLVALARSASAPRGGSPTLPRTARDAAVDRVAEDV
ncbi:MAG: hypothetical protein CVU56_00845 [Deltaproteobacteria bacterium HGW-Deltaproteobacteria-14]|jgi:signal transduction histidine kinase/ActR/RegA family two-component response regulator|nr:MAG: hypothetical protein CVU56_00845 [Deltaproteobacteria bacterium HGW-Deltaproteobacteria-14]